MEQIGIVGKPSRKRFQVVNHLEGSQLYRVRIFSSLSEMNQYLKQGHLSSIILLEEKFEDHHIELMDSLAHRIESLSVIYLVSEISSGQRDEVNRYEIPRCTVLDYNYELKDLKGVIKKVITGNSVVVRAHYRFSVSKRATLITGTGGPKRIQIVDLSAGGLQAKLFQGEVVQGEKVQIKVPKDMSRSGGHMIIGRVAWVNHKGAIGVQFEQVLSLDKPIIQQASA